MNVLKIIKKEVFDIKSDLDDDKDYLSICSVYDNYSVRMLKYIESKRKSVLESLFDCIADNIKNNLPTNELITVRIDEQLKNYIITRLTIIDISNECKEIQFLFNCIKIYTSLLNEQKTEIFNTWYIYEEYDNIQESFDKLNCKKLYNLFCDIKSKLQNKETHETIHKNINRHNGIVQYILDYIDKKQPISLVSCDTLLTLDAIIFKDYRQNQYDALKYMFDNRHKITQNNTLYDVPNTGICCQATGCGKTYIALNVLKMVAELNNYNSNITILWFTERKSILTDLFLTLDTKQNMYIQNNKLYDKWKNNKIIDMNLFILYEFVHNNDVKWYNKINKKTNKPKIIIINRTWLANNKLYKNITNNIPCLIIHDEMHSCTNDTTYDFFEYVKKNWMSSIIGFSATPIRMVNSLKKNKEMHNKIKYIYSTNNEKLNIISNHSIMNALDSKPKVIVPPKFVLFNSENDIDSDIKYMHIDTDDDLIKISKNEFRCLMTKLNKSIKILPYKKLIAWCGTIKRCSMWKYLFDAHKNKYTNLMHIKTYIDHSKHIENDYELFKYLDNNGILFCANKHREGSDISNLDGCLLLDDVKNRSMLVFIQCIGRVMRCGLNKHFGLVIDSYIKKESETNNQAIITKIIEYYNIISNSSTHYNDTKEKINQYKNLKEKLNLDIETKTIKINISGIIIDIKCSDMTWNSTNTIDNDITKTIKHELGFTRQDEKYLQKENIEIKTVKRKRKKIQDCLVDGQRIRHNAGQNKIWIGQYNASNNSIIHNDIEYTGLSPLNQFAQDHFIKERPDRKNNVNAWKDCECEIDGKWVSMYNL